jgi:hypothetical protein
MGDSLEKILLKILSTPKYNNFKKYFLGVYSHSSKKLEEELKKRKNDKFLFFI